MQARVELAAKAQGSDAGIRTVDSRAVEIGAKDFIEFRPNPESPNKCHKGPNKEMRNHEIRSPALVADLPG